MSVQVNNYTLTVIKSLFENMIGYDFDDITDASHFSYNYVSREGIYPEHIVNAYYSAMVIISCLTDAQFMAIKSIYE